MSGHQVSRRRTFRSLLVTVIVALGVFVQSAIGHRPSAMPVGNPPAENAVIRQVSVDEAGVVSYIKADGIYTSGRSGGVKREVAVGSEAPRTGGRFAGFLDLSSATISLGPRASELRIAFKAAIDGGRVSEGIFLFTEIRGVDAIALPGDIAPNTGGGGFRAFPGRVLISTLGTIMFRATVMGGKASEGLFFAPGGFLLGQAAIDSVAVQGEGAPATGGGGYASFGEYTLIEGTVTARIPLPLLKADVFAYIANVQGGRVPQGLYLSAFVIVTATPLQLELQPEALALVGNDAAGLRGESTYAGFEDIVLTTKPEAVFRARLAGSGGPSEGIFQIAFLGPVQVGSVRALQGDEAPVPGADVQFAHFGRMAGNSSEQLFFEADLQGRGPAQGLFLVTLGPLKLMSMTLSVGEEAPGTEGGAYSRLGPLSINDNGLVALQSEVNGGKIQEAIFTILAKRGKFVDGVPR